MGPSCAFPRALAFLLPPLLQVLATGALLLLCLCPPPSDTSLSPSTAPPAAPYRAYPLSAPAPSPSPVAAPFPAALRQDSTGALVFDRRAFGKSAGEREVCFREILGGMSASAADVSPLGGGSLAWLAQVLTRVVYPRRAHSLSLIRPVDLSVPHRRCVPPRVPPSSSLSSHARPPFPPAHKTEAGTPFRLSTGRKTTLDAARAAYLEACYAPGQWTSLGSWRFGAGTVGGTSGSGALSFPRRFRCIAEAELTPLEARSAHERDGRSGVGARNGRACGAASCAGCFPAGEDGGRGGGVGGSAPAPISSAPGQLVPDALVA